MLDAALLCLLSTFLAHSFGLLEMLWPLGSVKAIQNFSIIGGALPPCKILGGLSPSSPPSYTTVKLLQPSFILFNLFPDL